MYCLDSNKLKNKQWTSDKRFDYHLLTTQQVCTHIYDNTIQESAGSRQAELDAAHNETVGAKLGR